MHKHNDKMSNKQTEIWDWVKYQYGEVEHNDLTGLWRKAYSDVLNELETRPTDEELLSWLKQRLEVCKQMVVSNVYQSAINMLLKKD